MTTTSKKEIAFKIELWPIEKLIPYEKNNKVHPDEEIERLARNIDSFSLSHAIQVDKDGVIISGHGRRLALIKLGRATAPVIVRSDLSPEQVKLVRITDNTLAGVKYDTRGMSEELRGVFSNSDLTLTMDDIGLSKKEQDLLLSLDLTVPEMDTVMDNADEEIERQSDEDRERVEKADADQVKLHEILGFKTLSRSDARKLTRRLTVIESETGLKGRDALFSVLEIA